MTPAPLRTGQVLAYGALAVPLAFAALPLYVHVPKLYAGTLGLSLTLVGGVLLAARLGDAVADPLIGLFSDQGRQRRRLVAWALPLLACGIAGLLLPPAGAGAVWLATMLIIAYAGYSLASVNYGAWGAEAGADAVSRTRLTAAREGCALLGVVLASALPDLLAQEQALGLQRLVLVFLPLLALCGWISVRHAPPPRVVHAQGTATSGWHRVTAPLRDRPVRALFLVFACNGIAAAIPATIFLFFVADVLQRPGLSGLFLAVHFVSGALALPGWLRLARRLGKAHAWLVSMLVAMLGFGWAVTLGEGDVAAFMVVCMLSGFALGADITFPAAMLADALAQPRRAPDGGIYFGWWNLLSKFNLALAAGLALPLLEALGYRPGVRSAEGLAALAIVYALLPIVLKLVAAAVLWRVRRRLEAEGGM
ncbi:MFS transporter [Niveibacterium umoris]|uniref:Na+/melibiose symporter-like transporter n=1 Tax=Niveibacterium umoris TaxID=1193620 RepID=A0A840BM07_9RHOO|nr:MFS transporter [Niveibacterium umoris]MBB4012682.1 Na+/melibiose symporter-like transporter [Niveibacterium umoris]